MALTLAQEQALTEVAELLYDYLPASGARITVRAGRRSRRGE